MHLLTVTNLYPGEDMPRHGVFVEERLRQLVTREHVEASVIALRPYRVGARAVVARDGFRNGIPIRYLPVPTAPLVTNWVDPVLWAQTIAREARAIVAARKDVIIDAHFLYPDGAAAVIVGRKLDIPVVLTARGSDVNVKLRNPVMRHWIRWAAGRSAAIVTVSQALADGLAAAGVPQEKLSVLRNGVDLDKFYPHDRRQCQARFGLDGKVLLSVGNLIPEKGHKLAIDALQELSDYCLVIVGAGPDDKSLRRFAADIRVQDRVHFLGTLSHADLAEIYSSAHVLVLASKREGMPNVLLESLACGTPVVATDVGGIREIVDVPEAGALLAERSVRAIVESVGCVVRRSTSQDAVRRHAANFSWGPVIERQANLYDHILSSHLRSRTNGVT